MQVAANNGGGERFLAFVAAGEEKKSRRAAQSLNRFGRGRSADMLAGNEPLDIFRELQDEDDDREPNAIVDGLVDDLRDALRIGRFS